MPRIRTIKPDFFTSLTIADLTYEARLTFIGLWTHVDDEGRCVDDARLVKAALWPLDDRTAKDVDVDLWDLSDAGLIHRYTVDAKKFIAVSGWKEHQRINRPSTSKFPAPEKGERTPKGLSESSVRTHGMFSEDSREPRAGAHEGSFPPHVAPEMSESEKGAGQDDAPYPGAVVLPMFTSENTTPEGTHEDLSEDSLKTHDRKGKEQGKEGKGSIALRSARESDFEAFYDAYPRKKDPRKARSAYDAAIKRGATPEQLLAAAQRYAAERQGQEAKFTKHPTSWLNADAYLDVPDAPRSSGGVRGGSRAPVADADFYNKHTDEELKARFLS